MDKRTDLSKQMHVQGQGCFAVIPYFDLGETSSTGIVYFFNCSFGGTKRLLSPNMSAQHSALCADERRT